MGSERVPPDQRTIRISLADIESLPLSDEQKDALRALYSEQQIADEKRKAEREAEERRADLAYQTEQAEAVLSHPGWSEIRADWLDSARNERDRNEWCLEQAARTYVYDPDGHEYSLLDLPDDRPTIHQFYRDLYGSEVSEMMPERRPILVNHRDRMHPYEVYEDYPKFISAVQREQSFIYLGRFWEPTRKDGLRFSVSKKNAMTHINGICVDIDRVVDKKGRFFQASWVMSSLFDFLDRTPALMPNYMMLSGTGVQLWYVFGESIPLLSKRAPRRAKYDAFIKNLYSYFAERLPKNRFKVDRACAAYNHAFRAPGSPSKMGYPARLFVYGGVERKLSDPLALSDFIDGGLEPYDVGEWDPEGFSLLVSPAKGKRDKPASEKQLAYISKLYKMGCVDEPTFERCGEMSLSEADEAIKSAEGSFVNTLHWQETGGGWFETSKGHKVKLRPRSRKLYENALARTVEETKPGSRYMSMFVLAGLAYNCNVSRSALEHDLRELMASEWGRRVSPSDGKPINGQDLKSAMKGYNPIGCLRPKEVAERLLGWEFGPAQKRNGRTRKDHLRSPFWTEDQGDGSTKRVPNKARVNREAALALSREDTAQGKVSQLSEFLSGKPWASKRLAAKELHMSPPTVQKYWEDACERAGIEDSRTGNHSPNSSI